MRYKLWRARSSISFNPRHAGVKIRGFRSRSSWSSTANPNRRQSNSVTDRGTSTQILVKKIYLYTEPRQSHYHQLLILKRQYSQHLIITKRKSFKLYKNTTTVST